MDVKVRPSESKEKIPRDFFCHKTIETEGRDKTSKEIA